MSRPRPTIILLTLLALAAGPAECADGVSSGRHGSGGIVLAAGGVSLNKAIAMVERRFKARVVRSDVRQEGDRKIYVLRLLDEKGNAQVVRVDASTGAIL